MLKTAHKAFTGLRLAPLLRQTSKQHKLILRPCAAARSYATYLEAGQPIHETHPHRLRPGEVTPGITAQEYYARRQTILESLPDKSLVIIPGNDVQFATSSVFYEFRQDPNFYYLTGFLEPGSALALYKENENVMESIFFVPGKDAHAELWDGIRSGPNGAIEMFNADRAYPFSDIHEQLGLLLDRVQNVYMDTFDFKDSNRLNRFFKSHGQNVLKQSLVELFRKSSSRKEYKSAVALVEKSRLVKSEAEINVMRLAAEMSSAVYNKAYGTQFASEAQLQAFLDYEFRMHGCDDSAYLPVVAGGQHALTIHYTRNNDMFNDGDLVLVDAGGRYGGYCADISRTWPVNGTFTGPQRDLYQAVLNVNKQCIPLCTVASGMSLHDIHRHSEDIMYTELKNAAGFGSSLTRRDVSLLYPHYIGHNLGLDVHDITQPPRYSKLVPGQIITIEPGVYVPNDERFPKHFRGIGIRIEDDVVVGDRGYEVLTMDTLKEVDDIEAAAAEGRR